MSSMYESELASNNTESTKILTIIRLVFLIGSLFTAAFSAWVSSIKENGNEAEETWLRQRLYYAKLQTETQVFCDCLGDYSNLGVEDQIRKYMENIEKIRQTDWKNFFENMNCPNYEKNDFT